MCNMTYLGKHVTWRDLDLRSNSDIDLLMWTCKYFDAFRRGKQDAAKIASSFISSKVISKNSFCKKRCFDLSWPLQPNPLKLGPFWWHFSERTVKELSSAVFRGFLPIIHSEVITKKIWNSTNFDIWWPLVTSILTWAKNDNAFESTYWELSNAFPRFTYLSLS